MKDARILVIDDDPLTCTLLEGWSRHCAAQCATTTAIAEAEAALAQHAFDVALCDVHLPGNENLAWVRQVLARQDAPAVLLITGNPELQTTLTAANLPVAGYLVKPLDLTTLAESITRLVGMRRQLAALRELSRATAHALAAAGDEIPAAVLPLRDRLAHLAHQLQSPPPAPRIGQDDGALRASVIEAIDVLKRTKHSFRSKELGELRERLERSLEATRTPGQTA